MSNDFYHSSTFKIILLAAMVIQNSTTVLIGRYTRDGNKEDLYSVNHFILICECGKILLSCLFEYFTSNGQLLQSLRVHVYQKPYDALKILIPAVLYLLQNSVLYIALGNLTAPMFQVTYQSKLVTTAVVSVLMLNRKYSVQQWICLFVVSIGVAIVVVGEQKGKDKENDTNGEESPSTQSLTIGLIAVGTACFSSALAGVYFEKVVKAAGGSSGPSGEKQKPASVWMRNIQLAFFSICTAFLQGCWQSSHKSTSEDGDNVSKGYFFGFTSWVWFLVLMQSGGGLLVAAIIKYADNVLKGLATGVSVCLSVAVSTVIFRTPLSGQFAIGASLILGSVYIFSNPVAVPKVAVPNAAMPNVAMPKPLSGKRTDPPSSEELRAMLPT